ncbi:hypothetical protein KY290_007805 [Solanum tuberosum]|uniref:Uncharacterized protein n=1 Tax=Solanum tuberosum TaxID=4113 RepID=A0ABQ7W6R7_SOLTU|nr:hypothetical protein KY290_007805 [Solanum tuberosum]
MFSHLKNKFSTLQWEIIESQVGKVTHPEVQLNLDSNLVPTLPPPILITLTVPSHSNTLESIIERQLPAVSTSSGMIPISSQPPPLFNEAAHNTSQPLYYSRQPPITQQPPQQPAIMSIDDVPPSSGVVTRSKNNIFTPKKKFSFLAHLSPTPNTFKQAVKHNE